MEAVEYLLTLPIVDVSACAECVAVADDVDAPDGSSEGASGKSALHIAAIHDSAKIADILIKGGCPLCVQDLEVRQWEVLCAVRTLMLIFYYTGKYSTPCGLQEI